MRLFMNQDKINYFLYPEYARVQKLNELKGMVKLLLFCKRTKYNKME